METKDFRIGTIPARRFGPASEQVWLYVHGKGASRESAAALAGLAAAHDFQTLSFDLPEHGARAGEERRCNLKNAMEDLTAVGDYAFAHWKTVALYACSLGACFSLYAYPERPFARCLFESPIVDMAHLIRRMFGWFGVTESVLRERGEIPTPVDTLSWPYYQFVVQHPVETWRVPTEILYGANDELQSIDVMRAFAARFGCGLTVAAHSGHAFLDGHDAQVLREWMAERV